MRFYVRWLGIGLGGLVALLLLFAAFVYAASARALRRTYDVEAHPLRVPADSAAIAEGARLARIRGCDGSCHGDGARGQLLDEPFLAKGAVPDLTRLAHEYDVMDLERVIRHGVKPDGRSVVRFMPSEMYSRLSDRDLAAIVAYLRSLGPGDGPPPGIHFGPLARLMMAFGRIGFAAEHIDSSPIHPSPDRTDPVAFGRYLALTSCSECHGADLEGRPDGKVPDLRIAAAYSLRQFARLMREGVPADGRDLGLMKQVAVGRFSHFTDAEIAALYAFAVHRSVGASE